MDFNSDDFPMDFMEWTADDEALVQAIEQIAKERAESERGRVLTPTQVVPRDDGGECPQHWPDC